MKTQNGENRFAIFTILRHLHRAKRGADGYIELTLNYLYFRVYRIHRDFQK